MGYPSIYTTRTELESCGVPTSAWSNARVNGLLAYIGSFIDGVTAQRFLTYEETVTLSGDESCILHRPDLLPILSISDLSVVWNASNGRGRVFQGVLGDIALPNQAQRFASASFNSESSFDSDDFALKPYSLPRYIELVRSVFPGGAGNVSVTGVMGWPELSSVKATPLSTTTTTDLTTTSTSVTLTSVAGLKIRDVLLINSEIPAIVQAVDTGTRVVTIDAPAGLLTATIVAGATAKSYAAVPRDIEKVVHFLAMQEVTRQAQWAAGNSVDPTLIAGETVDKFSYKVFSPANTIGFGKAPGLTGVSMIDETLMRFTAPPTFLFA